MNYIDKETDAWPLTVEAIAQAHPEWANPWLLPRYASITEAQAPDYDRLTHKLVRKTVLDVMDGEHVWDWETVPLDAQELADVQAQEQARRQAQLETIRLARRVTKRQALLALWDLCGIKEADVLAVIAAEQDENARYRTQIDWQGAAYIEHDSSTVLMLAQALNITQRLGELFDYAAAQ
ncbi:MULTISPECIES: hypothetical protein [Delftia]|uniref:Uncharacterized protein n=1 Tax=Delftia acidovorans TaxID=80866 RepID=A0AAJ2R214_DELAC|nr:hypothetical protein [Delftia acidovorans]MDX4953812.1 hypothetical protein [Delftia acidovorans]